MNPTSVNRSKTQKERPTKYRGYLAGEERRGGAGRGGAGWGERGEAAHPYHSLQHATHAKPTLLSLCLTPAVTPPPHTPTLILAVPYDLSCCGD
ncbi:hypothetical protein E2C01_080455 [Portunus trituberculatus]|uniref:Uncharacterized protein n=1 Tax=Portunus trituberculatus TaxID=210409 RepID=A0A5B7IPB1_PORTR|nr:hypothetical protein [Portunus trituberculatus]